MPRQSLCTHNDPTKMFVCTDGHLNCNECVSLQSKHSCVVVNGCNKPLRQLCPPCDRVYSRSNFGKHACGGIQRTRSNEAQLAAKIKQQIQPATAAQALLSNIQQQNPNVLLNQAANANNVLAQGVPIQQMVIIPPQLNMGLLELLLRNDDESS